MPIILRGWFYNLKLEALKSDFPNFKIGSAVLHGRKVIAKGYNKRKTNPSLVKFGFYGGVIHAEAASILKAANGDTLVVIRILKNGNLSCSKPCIHCLAYAKNFGIKTIVYSDWNSNLRELKI